MLGPSSHLVGAIDKLPFISCAKNTTGAHCSEAGFPMMRGSAIAISVGDRLVRDVEHRDAVPAYAARTAVAPAGIDDVVRMPEGPNEGTLLLSWEGGIGVSAKAGAPGSNKQRARPRKTKSLHDLTVLNIILSNLEGFRLQHAVITCHQSQFNINC